MLTEHLPHYSYQDYLQWEGHWELIEGIPFAMSPAPNLQHQRISQRISQLLGDAVSNCQQCEVVFAVDWKIDEHTVVQPDNLITCHKETGQYLSSAPVLIFEILSSASEKRDRTTQYLRPAGYWVDWLYCYCGRVDDIVIP